MLDKLRALQNKGAEPSVEPATEPEAKPTESSAEPAAEPDAPAENAGKNSSGKRQSVLARMKAGKTGNAKGAAAVGSTPESPAPSASEAAINPPPKKGARAKSAKAPETSPPKPSSDTTSTTAKPATAAAQFRKAKKATKTDKSTLLIGCYPVQGAPAPTQLHELLADVKQAVCEANNVAHWGLIEFGKGDAALAQALGEKLKEEGVPPTLYAEPFSAESRAVEEVLLSHYDVVVRGLR